MAGFKEKYQAKNASAKTRALEMKKTSSDLKSMKQNRPYVSKMRESSEFRRKEK